MRTSFHPKILHAFTAEKPYKYSSFFLGACDLHYLCKTVDYLVKYELSKCKQMFFVGIFVNSVNCAEALAVINSFKAKYSFEKITFFTFSCSGMEDYDPHSKLAGNYARCARYSLLEEIWNHHGLLPSAKIRLVDSTAYVIDIDIEINSDPDLFIHSYYPECHLLCSWESKKSKSQDYTNSLFASRVKVSDAKYAIKCVDDTKVIKAGFSVFSASLQSKILLSQFRVYCFSDFKTVEKDPSRQLFSFYYGDQIALSRSIAVAKDLLSSISQPIRIGWVDLSTSKLASIDPAMGSLVYLPKGVKQS